MNLRMLASVAAVNRVVDVNGRTYTGVLGTPLSVPESAGRVLEANGWTAIAITGATSARPTGVLGVYAARRGQFFYDETLSKLIVNDGANWRDPATGGVV